MNRSLEESYSGRTESSLYIHLPTSSSSPIGLIRCRRVFFSSQAFCQLSSERSSMSFESISFGSYFHEHRPFEHPPVSIETVCRISLEHRRCPIHEQIIEEHRVCRLYFGFFVVVAGRICSSFQCQMTEVHTDRWCSSETMDCSFIRSECFPAYSR